MHSILKTLCLLICFELIIAPVAPGLSLLSDKAFAQSCPSGTTMDTTLNRCLTTTQAANVMNATMNCPAGDVECYKTNAQQAFQNKVNSGEAPERKGHMKGFVSTVANAATIAVPLAIAVGTMKTMKTAGCSATSLYAMIGGSAALFIGDNLANMQHKGRLKKIKEDWGKIVNPEDAKGDKDKERTTSIEAQSQAFEMLARAEDSLAKAAGMKKMFFTVAALAYTASGVMAMLEKMRMATNPGEVATLTCKAASIQHPLKKGLFESYATKSSAEDLFNISNQIQFNIKQSNSIAELIANSSSNTLSRSSTSLDEYENIAKIISKEHFSDDRNSFEVLKDLVLVGLNQMNPLPLAVAEEVNTNAAKAFKEDEGKGFDLMGLGLGAAAGIGIGMMLKGKVIMPVGRAALAGLLAGWAMIMRGHAASQQSASKKRAELLRKMKEEFASAGGAVYACASEDRNDPGKPTCYCYTADNQRNPNRTSSTICQNLWTGKNLSATDYNTLAKTSGKVCINSQNQADATCSCRTNNSCMKVKVNGISGINPGSMSMLSSSLDPLNKIANGSVDAADIDEASLENQAAKLNAAKNALDKSKGLEDFAKKKDKEALEIQNALNSAGAGLNPNSILGSSGSGMPSNPGQAALALEKELDEAQAPTVGDKGTIGGGGDAAPMNENLEFGLNQDQLAAQESQVAEVMKENLDFGGNDINPGSTTNLFEVLSNRYQRSGMRRLFDEKGETQAEPPSKTDITK